MSKKVSALTSGAKVLKELLEGGAGSAREYGARAGLRLGVGRQSDEEILRRISRDLPEMLDSAKSYGGFTADVSGPASRASSNLLPAGDRGFGGYMMAPRPEVAGSRVPASALDSEEAMRRALENLRTTDPALLDDLARGRYLGGWFDKSTDELVVDPARRYFTYGASQRAGVRSGQKAGFDVRRAAEYPVQAGVPSDWADAAIAAGTGGAGVALLRELMGD
jgi:hypothetical protein